MNGVDYKGINLSKFTQLVKQFPNYTRDDPISKPVILSNRHVFNHIKAPKLIKEIDFLGNKRMLNHQSSTKSQAKDKHVSSTKKCNKLYIQKSIMLNHVDISRIIVNKSLLRPQSNEFLDIEEINELNN